MTTASASATPRKILRCFTTSMAAAGTPSFSATTYARAVKQFGPERLINLVALMGNYAGTAALLATFDMQLPPGQKPLLPMR